jgi:hypothetical protein
MTKRRSTPRRVPLDLVKAGAILREQGFAVDDADPVGGWGLFDREGNVRKVHAIYASGWKATLLIHKDGGASLSYALTVLFKTQLRAVA